MFVSPERFATDSPVTIGFRKDYATKSSKTTSGGINYYYDRDYVIVDDIKMSYMGLSPAFLYEDENSLDYLVFDINHVTERPSAPPTFQYAGALSLARTLKKDQWNSFSLPIPLTGEQVRYAFGEEALLVELVSIGGLSQNSNVIDFRTVELKPIDPLQHAVEPGRLYMLKPTIDPTTGEDLLGTLREYNQLGRNYFSVNPEGEASSYEHYVMDAEKLGAHYAVGSYKGGNNGTAYVSYVTTPGFSDFAIDGEGYNTVSAIDTLYVPKGGYAVSGGTIYELNRDTPIKGFRGWITLAHSIFDEPAAATVGLRIAVDGVTDSEDATSIAEQLAYPVTLQDDDTVYDLGGRKVGTIGTRLPKGIYIVHGKKFFVK